MVRKRLNFPNGRTESDEHDNNYNSVQKIEHQHGICSMQHDSLRENWHNSKDQRFTHSSEVSSPKVIIR